MSATWAEARQFLAGLPDGGTNIAYEAVDRHVDDGLGTTVAIRWLSTSGSPIDVTYRELAHRTNRFARMLRDLGYEGGHGVATLCGRVLPLYVAALGTLKSGGVYAPLFSAFGPDPVILRLQLGHIDVLVTTATMYRRKVMKRRDEVPDLRHVLLIDGDAADFDDPTVLDLHSLMEASSDDFAIRHTDPEQPALLHFTSGTTGRPKGALHVHDAVVAHGATGRSVLTLRPGVVYWCTADPGWVTGTSYGLISPLVNGATCIIDEAEFDAERWYRTLQDEHVQILYTAPTALRLLQRVGRDVAEPFDLSRLELVASVGEPLDPESLLWARDTFGVPILDNWWQTETGAMMIANRLEDEVRPGSMGHPLPGVEASILACDDESEVIVDEAGGPVHLTEADAVGEIGLRVGWPSMFRSYLDDDERYRSCFIGDWYHSGDLGRRDADGYYWFVGRNNDVIKSAGHLIGPFEVESALTEHPSIVEAGVIGKPDDTMGTVVKAFVVLTRNETASDELVRDIRAHARKRLGAVVAPREIEIVDQLPHTRSGKIMRRLLKARELGLDEGDTSTLEVTT
jgi:acetyl-CoA synthetase